jgi:hypothetical protein
MPDQLSPRAREILAAVEREVSARIDDIEREAATIPPRRLTPKAAPLRAEPQLLAAIEMGVSGMTREEVADRLGLDHAAMLLDAVFGNGTPPQSRLGRAA